LLSAIFIVYVDKGTVNNKRVSSFDLL